jgi:hypothetical protein
LRRETSLPPFASSRARHRTDADESDERDESNCFFPINLVLRTMMRRRALDVALVVAFDRAVRRRGGV